MKLRTLILSAIKFELPLRVASPFPVIYTGIGKINATLSTLQSIQKYKPDLIVNYGTCGGIKNGIEGLVKVNAVIQRDMNAEPIAPRGKTPLCPRPHILFSSSTNSMNESLAPLICATGDNFLRKDDPWLQKQNVSIVDMELYAIASVCYDCKIPWEAYKFVSDSSDTNADKDWGKNVSKGYEPFIEILKTLKV